MAKRSIKKFIAFTRGSVTGLERRIHIFIIKLKFTTVDQGNDRGWDRTCVPVDINPSLLNQPIKG